MKNLSLLLLLFSFFSCFDNNTKQTTPEVKKELTVQNIIRPELQQIIDSTNVTGTILIYKASEKTFYSNDFDWAAKGQLPASTFKIPNSLIALETAVVENDSTLFKWDGEEKYLSSWEQDLIFSQAFQFSCVPCYQDIARQIGTTRMRENLDKLNYGNIVFDSTNIDLFWLQGDSKITPFQQIDFLERFYNNKLPISKRTKNILTQIMILNKNDTYTLSGKTGWSIQNNHNNGWFVGYLERKDEVYFFATNIDPKENLDMGLFAAIRKEITMQAFKKLEII